MFRSPLILAILALAPGAGIAQSAGFGPPGLAVTQDRQQRKPGPADLREAIEIALERFGGTAADAETVVRDGKPVHEIKVLLDDGSVRTVRVDPQTGAILPQGR